MNAEQEIVCSHGQKKRKRPTQAATPEVTLDDPANLSAYLETEIGKRHFEFMQSELGKLNFDHLLM